VKIVPLLFGLIPIFLLTLGQGRGESLRLLGRTSHPHDFAVGKTKLGGLSGISYDLQTKSFWAVSDDSAYHGGAPRIYQMSVQLVGTEGLQVAVGKALILRDEQGKPFPVADCEGIAATAGGGAWVTSEGKAGKKGALPWIRLFAFQNGRTLRNLPLPQAYLPANAAGERVPIGSPEQTHGVVTNRSLESCTLSPDRQTVYIANETSLVQDKAPGEGSGGGSGIFNNTQVRISALNAKTGKLLGQKLYVADSGCFFGSVSDVLALNDRGDMLVMERRVIRLQEGTGSCGIRIYRVNFQQPAATDLREVDSVKGREISALQKTLIYDSSKAGITDLDNLEGLGLAPLPAGRIGLVAVSDDNFSKIQQTQILFFELVP
jgi:hypothetical protein